MNGIFFLELIIFSGSALAWGAWELFSVNRTIKKREAGDAAAREDAERAR